MREKTKEVFSLEYFVQKLWCGLTSLTFKLTMMFCGITVHTCICTHTAYIHVCIIMYVRKGELFLSIHGIQYYACMIVHIHVYV